MTEKRAENQIDRFKQAARELGRDEDEAAFDKKIKATARNKPKEKGSVFPDYDAHGSR